MSRCFNKLLIKGDTIVDGNTLAPDHVFEHGHPLMSLDDRPLRLIVASGPALSPRVLTGPNAHSLGRAEDAAVHLPHESVSRHHAQIERGEDGWFATDCDSQHGTFHNTIRLEPGDATTLVDGDLLRIGPWTLAISMSVERSLTVPGELSDAPEVNTYVEGRDTYATRKSLLLRLGHADTQVQELSWREFTDRYGPVIRGFLRNAGLPTSESDDILQDVLLGFFRVSKAFEYDPSKGRFRGYLKRISLNAMRASSRRRPPGLIDDAVIPWIESDQSDAVWDQQWMYEVLERALAEAASSFEPTTLEAFELYGRRGVPAHEVAVRLDMSIESVRHAKSRVARKVRRIVERIREDEG